MPQSYDSAGNFTFVEHVPGAPQEQFEVDRSRAIRVWDCDWNKRHAFAAQILGYSTRAMQGVQGQQQTPVITRHIPHIHPVYTDVNSIGGFYIPFLYAQKVSIEGIGAGPAAGGLTGIGQTAVAKYEKARLTIEYGTFPYDIITDFDMANAINSLPDNGDELYNSLQDESSLLRYVTKLPRPNVEILTIPGGVWKLAKSPPFTPTVPISRPIHKSIPSEMFQITWHQIPEECIACSLVNPVNATGLNNYLGNYVGKVNSQEFAGYPVGTLLLVSIEFRPFRNPFGRRQYDITYNIKHFQPGFDYYNQVTPAGHNWIWYHNPPNVAPANATAWGWFEISMDGTVNMNHANGKSPFDALPFNKLFRSV